MRRIILSLIAFLVLASLPASASVSVTGNLKDLGVQNIVAGGTFVRFELRNYGSSLPRVLGTSAIAWNVKDFKPDVNGNISGTIYANDDITPAGTFYRVCVWFQGQLFRCTDFNILNSGGTFNITSATSFVSSAGPQSANVIGTRSVVCTFASPTTTWTCVHNIGDLNVLTELYNSSNAQFQGSTAPLTITNTDANTTVVTFSSAQSGHMTVLQAGSFVVSSLANTVVTNPSATQTLVQPAGTQFQVTGQQTINGTLFADATVLSSELAGAGPNTTFYIGKSVTLTAGLTISNSNVEFVCLNGAKFTKGANITLITITGNNVTLRGCTFDGTGFAGTPAVIVSASSGSTVENNIFQNVGSSSGSGVLQITGSTNTKVRNNRFSSISDHGIIVQSNTAGTIAEGNWIDTTGAPASVYGILLDSLTASQTVSNATVSNNDILNGSSSGYCVGAIPGLGNALVNIVITGNRCKLVANASGGYNASTVTGLVLNDNSFDLNGFTASVAAYNVATSTDVSQVGNRGGVQSLISTDPTSALGVATKQYTDAPRTNRTTKSMSSSFSTSSASSVSTGVGTTGITLPRYGDAYVNAEFVLSTAVTGQICSGEVWANTTGVPAAGATATGTRIARVFTQYLAAGAFAVHEGADFFVGNTSTTYFFYLAAFGDGTNSCTLNSGSYFRISEF